MSTENFWGNLISQLMKEQGVSQRKLAAETGISRHILRRIAKGNPRVTVAKLEHVLEYLGYELDCMPKNARFD